MPAHRTRILEIEIRVLNRFCGNADDAELDAHVFLRLVQALWFGDHGFQDAGSHRLNLGNIQIDFLLFGKIY